jgi:DNA replication and repair protein RecF
VVRDGRSATLEIEINPGKSNKARVNRTPLPRARELLGLVRTVVFAPDDLTLVKGDPSDRRKFLDDLLVLRAPRFAGVRSDYDRILRQRNTLLKTAGMARRGSSGQEGALSTLEVWNEHLARVGAELLAARLRLVADLNPYVGKAYATVARGAGRDDARLEYKASLPSVAEDGTPEGRPDQETLEIGWLEARLLDEVERRRQDELDRGVSLVGPHRDELLLSLGNGDLRLPVKGDDPILILDDVFAELDTGRREQLADLVAGAEQVLVTAAVADDVPAALAGTRYAVGGGVVSRES